jgi:hypothetical protein
MCPYMHQYQPLDTGLLGHPNHLPHQMDVDVPVPRI